MRLVLVVGARGSGKSQLLRQLAEQQANLGNPSKLGVVLRGQTAQSQDWPETIPLAHLSDGACVCCDSDALTRAVRAVEGRGCDVVALETDNFSEPDHLLSASRGLADAVSFACVVEPGAFQAAWTSNERQPYGEKRHVVDVLVEQIEQTHRVSLNRFGAEDAWLEDVCRALHPAVDIVDGADGVLLEPATQPEKPFEGVGRKRKKPRADRAVDCWTYEQRARPFHPHRLVDTVVRKLPVSRPGETLGRARDGAEAADDDPLGSVLRCRGFLWIAHDTRFALSHSGSHVTLDEAPPADEPPAPWGPGGPRSELRFIGPRLASAAIAARLDACLLTDDEHAAYLAREASRAEG